MYFLIAFPVFSGFHCPHLHTQFSLVLFTLLLVVFISLLWLSFPECILISSVLRGEMYEFQYLDYTH